MDVSEECRGLLAAAKTGEFLMRIWGQVWGRLAFGSVSRRNAGVEGEVLSAYRGKPTFCHVAAAAPSPVDG
jgi:hypothetical protein